MNDVQNQPAPGPEQVVAPKSGWLLPAFLIYFLLIAVLIMLFIVIAWTNGS